MATVLMPAKQTAKHASTPPISKKSMSLEGGVADDEPKLHDP